MIQAAFASRSDVSFRGWGMHADAVGLESVLAALWTATQPQAIANLLKVFSNRALPTFDDRLIALSQHDDPDVRYWAFHAIENNSHPLVRELAIRRLRESGSQRYTVGLFTKNFVVGDEQQLLGLLELPDDSFERHSLLWDLLKVLDENAEADRSQVGMVICTNMPCENCRRRAVKYLVEAKVAPDWLLEECRHDSSEECRSIVP